MPLTFLNRFEPTLGPDEEAYRLHFFASDKAQALRNALITLGLVLMVFALEVSFFDHQQAAPIIAVRTSFLVFSLLLFAMNRGLRTPAALDRTTLIWTMVAALQFLLMTAIHPPSKVDDVSMVIVVLALYALAPTPLITRAVPALFVTLGTLLVLWLVRDAPIVSLWPTAFVLVAINALGFIGSAHFHSQRRRQFQSQEKLRVSLQERDALIDRLRQSNKMESMGRIVGGVAHDFNNILGTMLASVEFLIAELPSGTTPRADAETLRGSVKRGADLTKQLLAFSRQQVLEPKVVSLNELVVDTQRMLMRTIGENVAIAVSLGDHLSAVKVDPGQVQQILLNLAVNSRDAMPNGGTLTIKTRNVTLTESTLMSHSVGAPGQYVVITVSDGGTGMDSATMAQIFEPFFTTKPKGRGTGLGLSTVFGIVEQSGGYIRVDSKLGEGSTFEIFLPAVSERPQTLAEPKEVPVPRGNETILLAEDDPDLRTLMARVLSAQGYQVLQATDGVDALRVAEQHRGSLDLLTTDMVMPAMGGYDLAHELSSRRPGVKVLFMSGYTDDAFGRGKLGPSDAFLQKPVDPKLLARKVRQVLDGSLVA